MTSRTLRATLIGVLLAGPAAAQSAASDAAVAEALFRDAKQAFTEGRTADACSKFAESQRIEPKLGTLVHLATCHEVMGKTATAWAEFTEAAGQAQRAKNREREKYARDHATALEASLSRLVLSADQPAPDMEIKLDGVIMGKAALGTPVPVDPGEHTVEATAPGRAAWSQKVTVEKGQASRPIAIPPLEAEKVASPEKPAVPVATPPPGPADRDTGTQGGSTTRTLAYVAGGTALLAIGVGAVFGLQTISNKNEAEGECAGRFCSQKGLDLYDRASGTALVSTIAFGVGVAALGTGAVLFLMSSGGSTKASASAARGTSPRLDAHATPGGGGLTLSGRF